MVYIVPQPHKCSKCGYEEETNSHAEFKACPKCLDAFLKQHVGEMIKVKRGSKRD